MLPAFFDKQRGNTSSLIECIWTTAYNPETSVVVSVI